MNLSFARIVLLVSLLFNGLLLYNDIQLHKLYNQMAASIDFEAKVLSMVERELNHRIDNLAVEYGHEVSR